MLAAKFCSIFVVSIFCIYTVYGIQRVTIKGKLYCNGKPHKGAIVKIMKNDGELMGKYETKSNGEFSMNVTERDIVGKVVPVLKIDHKCNKGTMGLVEREWQFDIPASLVGKGSGTDTVPIIFYVDLMLVPKREDCKLCLPVGK